MEDQRIAWAITGAGHFLAECAERLLRYAIRSGSESQQSEAIALLGALFRDAKQIDEAARVYRHLDRELTDVVCLEGKTGRQLVEALPSDGQRGAGEDDGVDLVEQLIAEDRADFDRGAEELRELSPPPYRPASSLALRGRLGSPLRDQADGCDPNPTRFAGRADRW